MSNVADARARVLALRGQVGGEPSVARVVPARPTETLPAISSPVVNGDVFDAGNLGNLVAIGDQLAGAFRSSVGYGRDFEGVAEFEHRAADGSTSRARVAIRSIDTRSRDHDPGRR